MGKNRVMSPNSRFFALMLGIASLLALLVYWGMHTDRRFSEIETLHRAPTAPPLQELRGGLRQVTSGQTVYVPVYSHIYAAGGVQRLLETTLSIRNTDLERPIIVTSVRYYDTEGRLLDEYLEQPVLLGPLASTDFLVEHRDRAGGAGANFLVDWAAENAVTEPVIEAVMVNVEGNRAFSFVRPGYPLSRFRAADAQ